MKKWLVLICAVMMLMSTAMAEKPGYGPGEVNPEYIHTHIFDIGTPHGDYWYHVLKDGTAEILGFSGSGETKIPSEIDGYLVTSLGQIFMQLGENITILYDGSRILPEATTIIIPNSVTYISERAFSDSRLADVVIPDSVTFIGKSAFYHCRLTNIVIPDSVTTINDYTFCRCDNLQSVTIPDSVTSIGEGAFAYCTALTSIIIPENVTSIGDSAFSGCNALTSVVVPESVTSIGDWVFLGCTSLLTLTVTPGSYAEQYAIDNNIPYVYAVEATPAEDFWTCTCGSLNDYNFCPNCGAARPVVEPTCSNCGYDPEGETPNFCPACGTRF